MEQEVSAQNNNFASCEKPTAMLRVILVWLKEPKAEIKVYALLDEWSSDNDEWQYFRASGSQV
jgi:hypothetical protein